MYQHISVENSGIPVSHNPRKKFRSKAPYTVTVVVFFPPTHSPCCFIPTEPPTSPPPLVLNTCKLASTVVATKANQLNTPTAIAPIITPHTWPRQRMRWDLNTASATKPANQRRQVRVSRARMRCLEKKRPGGLGVELWVRESGGLRRRSVGGVSMER